MYCVYMLRIHATTPVVSVSRVLLHMLPQQTINQQTDRTCETHATMINCHRNLALYICNKLTIAPLVILLVRIALPNCQPHSVCAANSNKATFGMLLMFVAIRARWTILYEILCFHHKRPNHKQWQVGQGGWVFCEFNSFAYHHLPLLSNAELLFVVVTVAEGMGEVVYWGKRLAERSCRIRIKYLVVRVITV